MVNSAVGEHAEERARVVSSIVADVARPLLVRWPDLLAGHAVLGHERRNPTQLGSKFRANHATCGRRLRYRSAW
jgi:hypothetical protein